MMLDELPAPNDVEFLLSAEAVAKQLDVEPDTIRKWSRTGYFLAPIWIGKLARWRLSDVNAWIASRAAAADEIAVTARKSAGHRRGRPRNAV